MRHHQQFPAPRQSKLVEVVLCVLLCIPTYTDREIQPGCAVEKYSLRHSVGGLRYRSLSAQGRTVVPVGASVGHSRCSCTRLGFVCLRGLRVLDGARMGSCTYGASCAYVRVTKISSNNSVFRFVTLGVLELSCICGLRISYIVSSKVTTSVYRNIR